VKKVEPDDIENMAIRIKISSSRILVDIRNHRVLDHHLIVHIEKRKNALGVPIGQ